MLFADADDAQRARADGRDHGIGVATANSILLVTFANEQRAEGNSRDAAALEAGSTRLRPVLMTALAMIIGMLPMALGLGEGGEQNAPLGRAVIGGLAPRDGRHAVLRPGRVPAVTRAQGSAGARGRATGPFGRKA